MARTVNDIISKVDQIIRDTSTNSVTANDRLQAISVATQEVLSEFGFDHSNATQTIDYLDGIHYYKITADIADMFEPVDLRRKVGENYESFTRKNPRELAVEIANGATESSFGIERRDNSTYLVINYSPKYTSNIVEACESLTYNGSWGVDSTNTDAINLTLDDVEFTQGSNSFNFDIDVSQSANNKAAIVNTTMDLDLSEHENISSIVFDCYVPENAYTTSFSFYIGTDTSNYWTGTSTTDIDGSSFIDGWNTIKIDWNDMTSVGSPSSSAIGYMKPEVNYESGQGDDTDYRFDNIRVIRPEKLTFYFQSYNVGTSSAGVQKGSFTTATDIPFFSGTYDGFDNPVSLRAASILFDQMGLTDDSDRQYVKFKNSMSVLKKKFPSSIIKETNSFKVKSIKW